METENKNEPKQEAEKKEGAEEKPADKDAGVQPNAIESIQQAVEARQGLAKENERMEKNIADLKELTANNILAGKADAGTSGQKQEVDYEKYARDALSGKLNKE